MIGVSVRLLSNRFRPISAAQAAALARARHAAGLRVEADWKGDVRVDTGTYRRSIHTAEQGDETVVSSDVTYSQFQEYGTRFQPARPSARQAAEKERARYAGEAQRAIGSVR